MNTFIYKGFCIEEDTNGGVEAYAEGRRSIVKFYFDSIEYAKMWIDENGVYYLGE